jgi:predicted helicase
MSKTFIEQYYKEKHKIANISRQNSESVLRRAFARLLERFGEKKHLTLIEEFTHQTEKGTRIRFDGVVKNDMGLNFGYWEAKANVDLEDEIRKKFNKGYPKDNIIFEDGKTAVLYQNGIRTQEVSINEAELLQTLLDAFFSFETPELKQFNGAVEDFKKALPDIATKLREMIDEQNKRNPKFRQSRDNFWSICQESINPEIRQTDVDEMLIQHILTEQIFMSVFGDSQFIQENNIAKELYQVEATFFTGNIKRNTLDKIKNYYEVIAISARTLNSHNDKQFFLKKVYENFYKAYNPKGADKLGIVYTPSEIVQFQIQGTEYLLEKHFGKTLSDKGVDILDPATGTGTYICDLIEHLNPHQLAYKYKHEIHANEVSILPYYIANLNIEYTFKNKMGYYEEFPNICFVDTLDNIGGLGWRGKQFDMFGFSAENAERIKKQNERKISVIIGNPPYNANQQNENDNNKNREYPLIDKRIKDTFIKQSNAQKTKVYDMYARFYRWAMDRLTTEGVISFITNRSFIDSKTFDGFRKSLEEEFDHIYIVDTNSDVRKNPKIAGTTHNVFGIQTGVAVMFLVKCGNKKT